ncbi:hypothetical protein [Nonomuraea salmonea]|uniref:TetR/AcrR family transcriptional regulator n=1 Tax=Nonomuraea salmonea TaxID=46181 RepID=UPI0031F1012C
MSTSPSSTATSSRRKGCSRRVWRPRPRSCAASPTTPPIPDAIRHVITATGEGRLTDVLLLLLRTSGDERTERMRVGLLRSTSEDLAAAAGWRPDAPEGEQLMLRAQLVLALSVGVATLRVSTGLRPLATASDEDLAGPLRKAVDALLPRP